MVSEADKLQDTENAAPVADGQKTNEASNKTLNVRGGGQGSKKTSSKKSAVSNSAGKLPMPSQQAGKLTTAYNRLKELRDARGVEAVVHGALKEAENALGVTLELLDDVVPEDELQRQFKESWISRNVTKKAAFIREAREALLQAERDARLERRSRSSTSSVARQAAAAAAAEEQRLRQHQQQLEELQELHQRQREEARIRELQEREQLQAQIEEARIRKEELQARADAASSVSPIDFPLRVPRLTTLGEVEQPTPGWIASARAAPPATDVEGVQSLLQHMLLLQAKVPTFTGDPVEYLWFKKAFQSQVESATSDPAHLLYTLLQKLEGEPHALVKGCQLALNPAVGYQRARELLDDRYGHPVRQALAFKAKLLNWPPIKKMTDLTGFVIQLQLCQEVKANAGRLHELDAAASLLQLAGKLPQKMQVSWQTKAVDIEMQHLREASFEDFVHFVVRQERARNHPVFGRLGQGKTQSKDDDRNQECQGVKSFQTAGAEQETAETTMRTSAAPSSTLGGTSSAPPNKKAATKTPKGHTASGKPAGGGEEPPNAFKAPCLFCKADHTTSKCRDFSIAREEKREKLRGLCFSCLKPGHSARHCKYRLKCEECDGLHPTCLHENRAPKKDNSELPKQAASEKSLVTDSSSLHYAIATIPVKVWAHGGQRPIVVKAVLDPASTATFVTNDLADTLKAVRRPTTLNLSTMTQKDKTVDTDAILGLKVMGLDEETTPLEVGVAYAVAAVPAGGDIINSEGTSRWPHLDGVPFHQQVAGPTQMLIGINVPDAVIATEARKGNPGEPYATKTALGWALQGPIANQQKPQEDMAVSHRIHVDADPLYKRFYEEFDKAFDFTTKGPSQEDREWLRRAEMSLRRTCNGHYSIELPFRMNKLCALENNYQQAVRRLQGLKQRLKASDQLRKDYTLFMEKMIDSGHAELVSKDTRQVENEDNAISRPPPPQHVPSVIHYVVHHGVYHPRKPGKIRVVFNCANQYHGVALNDCLVSGPDLTSSIVGVLTRFRQYAVAFMADIEAMFYQVEVPPEQRDALRFLWWPGGEIERDAAVYRLRVHLFGATSSPSIANFALRKAAEEAFKAQAVSEDVKRTMERNFYVDDCLKSTCTTEQAIKMANGLKKACRHGGFKLTKFTSSDAGVLRALDTNTLSKEAIDIILEDQGEMLDSSKERALGIAWRTAEDRLTFTAPEPLNAHATPGAKVTKRQVLAKLSQLYDPLGAAAPVTIVARVMFRELLKEEPGWDAAITNEALARWKAWSEQLRALHDVSIPRWLGPQSPEEPWQIHAFSDASKDAYAAVVYLARGTSVAFVVGKARVTPPKVVTIPRLELTAAKLAAEMMHSACQELEINVTDRFLWTDSQTVLKYLRNQEKRFHVFVANRVEAILHLTDLHEWHFVPTAINPADEGTRGLKAAELKTSSWIQGPRFLTLPEAEWPEQCINDEIKSDDKEVKKSQTTLVTETEEMHFLESIASRCSTLKRFQIAMAACIRLKEILRGRAPSNSGLFRVKELKTASMEALKWLQRDTWPEEWEALQHQQHVRKSSTLHQLTPVITNGLMMIQSRVLLSLPIVPCGQLGRLVVREAHRLSGHLGRQTTAATARRRYWVVGLNKLARQETKDCPACQRRLSKPDVTQMAPLPEARQTPGPPFTVTGVDYFGPFDVYDTSDTHHKAYGVIFTCATSRAVHIEVAATLDKTSFINALRRFIARRGNVRQLISDNGTNFSGADTELKRELRAFIKGQESATTATLRDKGIDWVFNPPGASHYGGFYERLIRSTKAILEALLNEAGQSRAKLTMELLTTLFCEVEAILNARPLTAVSEDAHDFEALTPNHLLLGQAAVERMIAPDFRSTATALRRRWRLVQSLAIRFWKRWSLEYFSLLHKRSKWHRRAHRQLQKNDIVLIVEPKPRNQWRLGRVVETHQSRDGEVRAADVRTSTGVIARPIMKLCVLETASRK